ncbi:hypothetical protein HDU91_007368, partial [Kappamyces sp. JEL0680]
GVATSYDGQLLDTLSQYGIVATFFVNGYNWNDLESDTTASNMLRQIQNAGHQIASHTYSHRDLATLTIDEIYSEMRRNDVAITNVLGSSFAPRYLRAPYGSINNNILTVLQSWGYTVVWENILNHDTDHTEVSNAQQLAWDYGNYTATLMASNPNTNSFISLNHDQLETTSTMFVQQIIPVILQAGYRFVSLGECLHPATPNSWYRQLP